MPASLFCNIDAFRVVAHQTAEKLKTSHSFEYHALNSQSESQNSQSNAKAHKLLQTHLLGVCNIFCSLYFFSARSVEITCYRKIIFPIVVISDRAVDDNGIS